MKDGGGSNLPFDAPFIITPSGIRFQSVQEIEGVKFQVLNLNTEKTALVSSDNPDIKLTGTSDLALYFASNASIVWKLVFDNSSQNISTLLNQIRQSCITKYNASDVKLSILWTPLHQYQLKLSFQVANQLNEGNLDLNISSSGKNALLFYYKTTGDVSGLTYYNEVAGLKELVSILSSGFVLSANTTLNFKEIKLTKKTDSNTWFTISK